MGVRCCGRLHQYAPVPVGRRRTVETVQEVAEEWRRHYPLFPRLLFVLDGTGPAGIDNRVRALHAADVDLAVALLLREVTVLAAPMTDLLQRTGPPRRCGAPYETRSTGSAGPADDSLRFPILCCAGRGNCCRLSTRCYRPKAPPSMRMSRPMAIRTTGSRMWPHRLSAFATTGRGAKNRPAKHHMPTRIRKTTAHTLIQPTPAVANTGT